MNQQSIQRAIRHDKIERARQMSLGERLAAGAKLYAEQLARTRDLLHGLHPEWSSEEIDTELTRRRHILDSRESKRFYRQDASPGAHATDLS